MIKKVLTLLGIIFFVIQGNAQKVILGFEAFSGISNTYISYMGTDFRNNLGATFTSSFNIKNNLYFQTGLGYDKNGYAYGKDYSISNIAFMGAEKQDFFTEWTTKYTHHNLTFPLNIKFANIGNKDVFTIQAGAYYSYLFSRIEDSKGYIESSDNVIYDSWDKTENVTDEILKEGHHDAGINLAFDARLANIDGMNFGLGVYAKLGLLSMPFYHYSAEVNRIYSFGLKMFLRKGIVE